MSDTTEELPNVEEPDTTEADLRTWGLSGQPSSWALVTWVHLIDTIRAVNTGAGDATAVQDELDALFPDAGYAAANVTLAHPPVGTFSVTMGEANRDVTVTADDADLDIPDENITWELGDGTTANGDEVTHTYEADGDYAVRLYVMVAGERFGSGQEVTIGEGGTPAEVVDPGLAAREATVFESETDDLPNTTVTQEESDAQAAAVAEAIEAGTLRTEPNNSTENASIDSPEPYDPSEHTVDEVLAYAAEHPDEVDAIRVAEENGKARVTILDKL